MGAARRKKRRSREGRLMHMDIAVDVLSFPITRGGAKPTSCTGRFAKTRARSSFRISGGHDEEVIILLYELLKAAGSHTG